MNFETLPQGFNGRQQYMKPSVTQQYMSAMRVVASIRHIY